MPCPRVIPVDQTSRYLLKRFALKCAFFLGIAAVQWRWGFDRTLATLLFLAAVLDVALL